MFALPSQHLKVIANRWSTGGPRSEQPTPSLSPAPWRA